MGYWFEGTGYVIQNTSFVAKQPVPAAFYLFFVGFSTVVGSTGNILILGAIYVSKVRALKHIFIGT